MKCHECGQHQSDSNTKCAGCGAGSSAHGAAAQKIIIYDDEPARTGMNMKIGAGLIAVLCLVGAPFLFGGRSNEPAENVAVKSDAGERTERRRLEQNSAMGEACMQSMMQMGSDEVSARANCYDDKDALKKIRNRNDREVKIRNTVPASKISRIKLLISDNLTPAVNAAQPFALRLRLYDEDGKPASSDGEVKISFSPDGAVWGGFRNTRIYGGNARVAEIADEDLPVPFFEFRGYQINKDQLEGASEIEITATFADSLEASARYSISYSGE